MRHVRICTELICPGLLGPEARGTGRAITLALLKTSFRSRFSESIVRGTWFFGKDIDKIGAKMS